MTFDKIKEIFADQLDVDAETLTLDTDMAKDLNADSLDVVEILMSIEDEFEVEIPVFGKYAFSPDDVDTLFQYIKEAKR